MKKSISAVLWLLAGLLFAGTMVISYFTRTKMGMARYLIYLNGKIDGMLGGTGRGKILLVVAIVLIAADAVTLTAIILKRKDTGSLKSMAAVVSVAEVIIFYYVLLYDRNKVRDYYVNSALYIVIGIVLLLNLWLGLRSRNEAEQIK